MSEEERDKAFANAQQKQGDPAPRSYLDIYLSNKQWEKTDRYGQATALFWTKQRISNSQKYTQGVTMQILARYP